MTFLGASDWEWWDDVVPEKLRDLNKDGYRVVFFTNQAGIEKLKVKPEEIMKKVEDIIAELGIPVLVRKTQGQPRENHEKGQGHYSRIRNSRVGKENSRLNRRKLWKMVKDIIADVGISVLVRKTQGQTWGNHEKGQGHYINSSAVKRN